ncbi:GAF domain-containing protein [Haloarcula japonica]|uniref:Bacterio-opsin activator-like protein n=1 Tax=Haloarcula japonica (strain ATCC 49778 / DSM 6131 / JCM 7785 / NBRC 101032 / NCIMB 13157 / TR-1) TaxID=1227453 RepID=M0L0Q7_HALJT|nr:GAF domain-containing protein [Haloarcula japonica]EMA27147.1 bacterio-opsin activator-like protein [Haloarcula japonica DSM 6131]
MRKLAGETGPAPTDSGTAASKIKVLLVDDYGEFRQTTAELLEHENNRIEVIEAANVEDALSYFDSESIDCIVSDYEMPEADGIEFVETVRQSNGDLPFILLTGQGSEKLASEAVSAGVTDYFVKGGGPEQYAVLTNRIENAVESHRFRRETARLSRINSLFREINRQVLRASTADEIKEAVCEILTSSDAYQFAWIGEKDEAGDIVPTAGGGDALEYVEAMISRHGHSVFDDGPLGHAIETGEQQVASDIRTESSVQPWHELASEYGFRSMIVLPIQYTGSVQSVISIYADTPFAFDEAEQTVLTELAEIVADGLHSTATRAELEMREEVLRTITEVFTARDGALREQIADLMQVGRSVLGTEYATLSRVNGMEYDFEVLQTPDETIFSGGTVPLSETPCAKAIANKETVVLTDVDAECGEADREHIWDDEVNRYLGTPLTVGGSIYGTLCFYGSGTGRAKFSDWDVTLVDLLSKWIGNELQTQRAEMGFTQLYETATDLLGVTSEEEAAQIVVSRTRDIIGLPEVVLYAFDSDTNTFRPLSATEGEEQQAIPADGDSFVSSAFFTEETIVFDGNSASKAGEDAMNDGKAVFVPLGDHGVLRAGDTIGGEFDTQTRRITELLGATIRTAFDRLTYETELEDRQRDLEQQTVQLEQMNRLTELSQKIHERVLRADSRSEIEQAVCDQLVASDICSFAWIGEYESDTDRVTPRTWAGTDRGFLEESRTPSNETPPPPAVQTARTNEQTLNNNIADGLRGRGWQRRLLERGFQSVISIPLSYQQLSYGILTVYAKTPDVFDLPTQSVLEEVSETVGYAINSIETKQGLVADRAVELQLEATESDDIIHRIAGVVDTEITFEGIVPQGDTSCIVFFSTDASPDDLQACLDTLPRIERLECLTDTEDTSLFEATVSGTQLALTVAEQGGAPQLIQSNGKTLEIQLEVPQTVDIRQLIAELRRSCPDIELVGRHKRERGVQTRESFHSELTAQLTPRQFEVLLAAFYSGFYQSPRDKTGQEIADTLDISQPTFSHHLRVAIRKLLEQLFSEGGTTQHLDR